MKTKFRFLPMFAFALMLPSMAQAQEKNKQPPFEFKGYVHLKLVTSPSLTTPTPTYDTGYNTMGREGSTMGWIRLSPIVNLEKGARLVTEIESSGQGFQNLSGEPFAFTNGALYLEMPATSGTKLWFGRRRIELNQQRWSDGKPFNPDPDRLNGGGVETAMGDIKINATLGLAKKEINYTAINNKATLKTVLGIVEATQPVGSNASLTATLIGERTGSSETLSANRDTIKSATPEAPYQADSSTNAQAGVALTQWGEGWWNNAFGGIVSQDARPSTADSTHKVGRTDKDYIVKLGTQGGFNGLAESMNVGLYYGGRIDYFFYQNNMQVLKVSNEELANDGTKKTNSGLIFAANIQPVYYFTQKIHGALDATYTYRSKLRDKLNDNVAGNPMIVGLPSATAFSAIVRYANRAEPIALPQLYAGITHTLFDAKHPWLVNEKNEKLSSLTTVQAGIEASF